MMLESKYDTDCRNKYHELLKTTPRIPNYSPSQLVSVMVVMECGTDEAMKLIDKDTYSDLDWSEATWEETYEHFVCVRGWFK
jgi:hypothetical protein